MLCVLYHNKKKKKHAAAATANYVVAELRPKRKYFFD